MTEYQYNLKAFGESLNNVKVYVKKHENTFDIQYQVELSSFLDLWDKQSSSLERKIGLWEGTCFEAFLYNKLNGEYIEFNFSGTGFWNAFHFKQRDQELKEYQNLKLRKHRFITSPQHRTFEVQIDLSELPFQVEEGHFLIGITCILVNEDQEKEYFAIKHCQEKPDFHDPDSFVSI